MRLAEIGQIGLVTIADIEQVSQSFDGIALLAFAQQCGDRHAEKVPQEIKQRHLEYRHRVNGRARNLRFFLSPNSRLEPQIQSLRKRRRSFSTRRIHCTERSCGSKAK